MRYDSMKEMLESIRVFMRTNPDALLEICDIPTKLCIGFKATKNNIETFWNLRIVHLKNNDGALNEEEMKIVDNHLKSSVAASKAEKAYINMIAGRTEIDIQYNETTEKENLDELKNICEKLNINY